MRGLSVYEELLYFFKGSGPKLRHEYDVKEENERLGLQSDSEVALVSNASSLKFPVALVF